jgi:hypothetical protein
LPVAAQIQAAPDRPAGEGEGPFERLILRAVTLVDGTGAPPYGPVDIVVEGNRIVNLVSVGAPGAPIEEERRPATRPGDRVLELEGHYVLPGFVDLHGHLGGEAQGVPAEYVPRLWMAHGITTSADPGSGNGIGWMLEHQRRSRANEIADIGSHGIKFFGLRGRLPPARGHSRGHPEGCRGARGGGRGGHCRSRQAGRLRRGRRESDRQPQGAVRHRRG